jgi:hypothetical protein
MNYGHKKFYNNGLRTDDGANPIDVPIKQAKTHEGCVIINSKVLINIRVCWTSKSDLSSTTKNDPI